MSDYGFNEAIRKIFDRGGKAALLGELYMEGEEIYLTSWDETLEYADYNGTTRRFSPAPFFISEEIVRDPRETALITVFMGITHHENSDETDEFTSTQIGRFTQLMQDLDEYLETHEIRGSLGILRLVNPDDLTADLHLFTGIVDTYKVNDNGIILELSDPNDVVNAPSYPISTMCPYQFGDSRTCGVDKNSAANLYQGTVDAGSTTSSIIDSSMTNNSADDYWRPGVIKMTSGDAKGQTSEVRQHVSASNQIVPDTPFEGTITTGDTFDLRRICRKTLEVCDVTYSNKTRFGGYPYVNNEVQGLFFRGR